PPPNRTQPLRLRKRRARQSAGYSQVAVKFRWVRRPAAFCGVNGGYTWILSFGQTDPKIKIQRLRKRFAPILRERFPGDPTHEFIEKESKRASVITMCGRRQPQWLLHFKCPDHGVVLDYINTRIQSAKSGAVGKQLRQRDFLFAGLSELGPKLRYAPVDANSVLLQYMQDACAANSLAGRPDEDERISFPGFFVAGIAKSVVKIDNWFSILPDRHSGSQLSKLFAVLPKKRLQSLDTSFRIELRVGSCRAFDSLAPARSPYWASRLCRSAPAGSVL